MLALLKTKDGFDLADIQENIILVNAFIYWYDLDEEIAKQYACMVERLPSLILTTTDTVDISQMLLKKNAEIEELLVSNIKELESELSKLKDFYFLTNISHKNQSIEAELIGVNEFLLTPSINNKIRLLYIENILKTL